LKLALLRHGPTDWNAQGRVQGHTDIGLSAEGLAQMSALRLPEAFAAARVYASPLTRARQTAAALGLAEPLLDARLMEQHWGSWEGLTRAEMTARDGDDCFARAGLRADFRPPGGESTQELHDRVAAFLRDVAAAKMDAVAVTHLGVLRAAYTMATGWAMETPMPAEMDLSKILVLALDRTGKLALAELNVGFITQDGRCRSL
jgi:broad specificity phosphatase PhoE